ncbi:unnamed protein product [Acanthoscelides obtectus]|uniref:Uncharacterized protein n=1 Tax=Acanthoscelides obtectus TaxID=200917 RepID=A0A9P0JG15_ACAOB|nr:unnamed protein product [Acanthoscelides obtectus]CAK1661577.1 hypothetical protein AOBTE_LOCUS22694 [Acanthoscelides obtectus]
MTEISELRSSPACILRSTLPHHFLSRMWLSTLMMKILLLIYREMANKKKSIINMVLTMQME